MTRIGIAFSIAALAAVAACGGASAGAQRPLASGEARPSQDQCVAAVDNYEHCEFTQVPYPLQYRHALHDVAAQQRREQRLRQCSTELTATEAVCMSKAESLTLADACAPTERW
jgi:hypothetical protein